MKKLNSKQELELRKQELEFLGTCYFETDEELEDYWREVERVDQMLTELKK